MAKRESRGGAFTSICELSQAYLDWCGKNRKARTCDNHLRYLKSFVGHVGKRLKIAQLRQHHLPKWLEERPIIRVSSSIDAAFNEVTGATNWASPSASS